MSFLLLAPGGRLGGGLRARGSVEGKVASGPTVLWDASPLLGSVSLWGKDKVRGRTKGEAGWFLEVCLYQVSIVAVSWDFLRVSGTHAQKDFSQIRLGKQNFSGLEMAFA